MVRAGEKIISLVKEISGEQELVSMEDIFPFMDAMQMMFPQWVFMVCPLHHPETRYISSNCEQLLGYTKNDIYGLFPAGIMAHAHEDDQEEIRECFSYLHDFLKDRSARDLFSIRFSLQYRVKHRDGKFLLIHDQKASLVLKNSTSVYYSIMQDITEDTAFAGVRLDIYRQDPAGGKLAEFRPAKQHLRLSKRETQLVALIRKGLRTKEIADHLNISHHTVRNIRQKMFEKYNVSNSIELLNKAM